jgi:hypothetical protein
MNGNSIAGDCQCRAATYRLRMIRAAYSVGFFLSRSAGRNTLVRMWRRDTNVVAQREIPLHLATRCTQLSPSAAEALVRSLRESYFGRHIWGAVALSADQWLATAAGRDDMHDHRTGRLHSFRANVIPWLALAEQGAQVTAIDIDEPSLRVAKDRCQMHGVECELARANAADAAQLLKCASYDFVIFFACLEHMTRRPHFPPPILQLAAR